MNLKSDTKVRHDFGIGKIINYIESEDTYLVYFPLRNNLHNGRLIARGIEGYETNQYWFCDEKDLQVITEEEYNKELREIEMKKEKIMKNFKINDTIKFNGDNNECVSIPHFVRTADLLKIIEYNTENNKVKIEKLLHCNNYQRGDIYTIDIDKLEHFKHDTIACSCCDKDIDAPAITIQDGDVLCNDCFSEQWDNGNIVQCEDCNDYVYSYETVYVGDRLVCKCCYDDNYRTCEHCGRTEYVDYMNYNDYDCCWYCNDCYTDSGFHEVYNSLVKLEKGERYFGMELEVERYDDYCHDITNQIMDIMGTDVLLEIKEDGSLDSGGFEIVFQPLSEEYINSDTFRDKLTQLSSLLQRNNFYKEAPNGGIHIHTTRLGGEDIADLYTLARFFEPELKQINARFDTHWCDINEYTTSYGANKEVFNKLNYSTRYQWWNNTNDRTIECRAFASSLDVDTIINDYNFVINAFKYRCDKKVKNITWDMLMGKSSVITKTTKVYSIDTLRYIKKLYKVNDGKIRAIKHIMSVIDKEIRLQLDNLNYDKVALLSTQLRQFNNIMTNSHTLRTYTMNDIASMCKSTCIEEVNEYIRHL